MPAMVTSRLLNLLARGTTTAAASAGRRLKQAQDTVSDYRARLAKLDGRLESDPGVADGQARMDALQTRKRELDAQYSAILLAQRTLQEADAEIQQIFSPRLSAKASEIMQYFTRLSNSLFNTSVNSIMDLFILPASLSAFI